MRIAWHLLIVTLAGCAGSVQPQARHTAFDASEYAGYGGSGNATITGQAFAKTKGGDVKYAAGNTIVLNPVTTYSTEWWDRWVVRGEALEDGDPRAKPYARTTNADGEGRFKFANVPPGSYYVMTSIHWMNRQVHKDFLNDVRDESLVNVGAQIIVMHGMTVDAVLEPRFGVSGIVAD